MERDQQPGLADTPPEKERRKMTLANFILGRDMVSSPTLEGLQKKLGNAGVLSYEIEVEGSSEPELELDGATYVGEAEMAKGIDSFIQAKPRA